MSGSPDKPRMPLRGTPEGGQGSDLQGPHDPRFAGARGLSPTGGLRGRPSGQSGACARLGVGVLALSMFSAPGVNPIAL